MEDRYETEGTVESFLTHKYEDEDGVQIDFVIPEIKELSVYRSALIKILEILTKGDNLDSRISASEMLEELLDSPFFEEHKQGF